LLELLDLREQFLKEGVDFIFGDLLVGVKSEVVLYGLPDRFSKLSCPLRLDERIEVLRNYFLGVYPVFVVKWVLVDCLVYFCNRPTRLVSFTSVYDKHVYIDWAVKNLVFADRIHSQLVVALWQFNVFRVHHRCSICIKLCPHCLNFECPNSLEILFILDRLLVNGQSWRVTSNFKVKHHVLDEWVVSLRRNYRFKNRVYV
jgi:hypothetical protein